MRVPRFVLRESVPRAVLWMLGSVAGFSMMSVMVKRGALDSVPSPWLVFARGWVSLILVTGMGLLAKDLDLRPVRFGILAIRGAAGFAGVSCLFYSLARLPLPVATVLNWSSMLFVAFFSRMFLKERLPRGGLFFAILALLGLTWVVGLKVGEGFTLGVPVIPVLVAIFGAFAAGIAYTAVRAASSQYSSHTIVFWFSMVMTALSLPQLLASGEAFRWEWAPLLLSVGGLATAGQVCMTQAYRFAPAPMVSVLNLLNAPGVALLGYFFFGEVLLPGQWVGIALVGASLSALGWLQYRSSALRSG